MKKGQIRNEAVRRGFIGSAIDAFVRGYEYAESNQRKDIKKIQKVKEEVRRTIPKSNTTIRQEQKRTDEGSQQSLDKSEYKEKEDSRTIHSRVERQEGQSEKPRQTDLDYF